MARFMEVSEYTEDKDNYCYTCGEFIKPNTTFYRITVGVRDVLDTETQGEYRCCSAKCIDEVTKSWFKANIWDWF